MPTDHRRKVPRARAEDLERTIAEKYMTLDEAKRLLQHTINCFRQALIDTLGTSSEATITARAILARAHDLQSDFVITYEEKRGVKLPLV